MAEEFPKNDSSHHNSYDPNRKIMDQAMDIMKRHIDETQGIPTLSTAELRLVRREAANPSGKVELPENIPAFMGAMAADEYWRD